MVMGAMPLAASSLQASHASMTMMTSPTLLWIIACHLAAAVLASPGMAAGHCVPVDNAQREVIIRSLNAVCPLYANTYRQASGIYINISLHEYSKLRKTFFFFRGDQLMEHYMGMLLGSWSAQLRYYQQRKQDLVTIYHLLQWKRKSELAISYLVDMLMCSTFVPACTYRTVADHAAAVLPVSSPATHHGKHWTVPSSATEATAANSRSSLSGAGENYTPNRSDSSSLPFVTDLPALNASSDVTSHHQVSMNARTSADISDGISSGESTTRSTSMSTEEQHRPMEQLRVLRLCSGLCTELQSVLGSVRSMAGHYSKTLQQKRMYFLLSRVMESCGSDTSLPGQRVHCLNVTDTAHGYGVVEEIYPYKESVANLVASSAEAGYSPSISKASTYGRPPSVCFNISTRCTRVHAYVETDIAQHWNPEKQAVLKRLYVAIWSVLNVTSMDMPFTGKWLPCAESCVSRVMDDSDIRAFGTLMAVTFHVCMVICVFALCSFCLQWRRMSKYPMQVLLYLDLCALLSSLGFSLRFYVPSGAVSLICHADGSRLFQQPRAGDDASLCAVQFSISYYFLLASSCWWACLAHSWYITFSRLYSPRSAPRHACANAATQEAAATSNCHLLAVYHMASWIPALILLIIVLVKRKVSGVLVYGFCWLDDPEDVLYYLVVPQGVALLTGSLFMCLGMRHLWSVRRTVKRMLLSGRVAARSHKGKKSGAASGSQRYMIQMPVFVALSVLLVAMQVSMSIHEVTSMTDWKQRLLLRDTCLQLTCTDPGKCPPLPRARVAYFLAKISAYVLVNVLGCAWAFLSPRNWSIWKNLICSTLLRDSKAFTSAGRKQGLSSTRDSRISCDTNVTQLSCHSMHVPRVDSIVSSGSDTAKAGTAMALLQLDTQAMKAETTLPDLEEHCDNETLDIVYSETAH
eukprot:scpid19155/ scgid7783/ Frizzled-10